MNEEMLDLIKLIDELDNLRMEHTLTYEGLHKVTELMKDYAWETEKHFPLNESIDTHETRSKEDMEK